MDQSSCLLALFIYLLLKPHSYLPEFKLILCHYHPGLAICLHCRQSAIQDWQVTNLVMLCDRLAVAVSPECIAWDRWGVKMLPTNNSTVLECGCCCLRCWQLSDTPGDHSVGRQLGTLVCKFDACGNTFNVLKVVKRIIMHTIKRANVKWVSLHSR